MEEYERIMRALRAAHAAGDEAGARRLAVMASRVRPQAEAPAAQPEQTRMQRIGQTLYENIIGSGEIDTPGERLGELVRGGTAAIARGMADVPALPANIAQLGAAGVERLLGMEEPSMVSRALERLPETREMLASVPVIGPETEYVAPGRAGQFVSTAGEFAGGAGLLGRAGDMIRFGALPGLASEAAGQATEGTALEPYARTAAALGTAFLGVRPSGRVAPIAGADDEAVRLANILSREGVRPTAGQVMESGALRRAEGMVQPSPRQLEDFTAAAMRSIGSDDVRATQSALATAERNITNQMDDILRGVSVAPDSALANRAAQIAADYLESAPAASVVPRVRNIVDEIIDAATTPGGKQIELETLRTWRTALGRMTQSSDEATRNAAVELRRLIDGATDAALSQAGRADQLQALREARTQYRNFLAVRDASTRAGAETGVLTPAQLNQSVIRTQGRAPVAVGRGTELADLSRAGAALLRPLPTVEAGGVRRFLPEVGAAGAGGLAGLSAGGVPGAVIGGTLGALAPVAGQAIMRSAPLQTTVLDPFAAMMQVSRTAPGLLSQ
jgi:hypothetical protein